MNFPASSVAQVKCCITCNTFGVPAPMKEILEMCKTQRWVLIEDVCEAIGTTSDGQVIPCPRARLFWTGHATGRENR